MTHKTLNNNINIDLKMTRNSDIHEYNTMTKNQLNVFKIKTEVKRSIFSHKATIIYNNLPAKLKNINDFPNFKKQLKNYVLNSGVT